MKNKRDQRRAKIRKTIVGSSARPRLVVFRSNRYFYAQAIDDLKKQTVASVNKIEDVVSGAKELAEKLKKLKINQLVFDRAGYRFHGKVKTFAESVEEGGIKI